jgi:peptidyl-prolyl cis-trans isomerase D
LLAADGAKIAQSLNPTDADLMVIYNQNQANFRTPEHVNVRHILLMTQGKPAGDDAKIKAKAEDLVKQLRAGADFVEMAKKNSEDPGSASKGGEYDNVVRGQMDPAFEKAAFSQKPMVISDPVKSAYGYHIIQVLAHEDARLKPFAEVKDELAKQWKQQRVSAPCRRSPTRRRRPCRRIPIIPTRWPRSLAWKLCTPMASRPDKPCPGVGASPDFDQAIAGLKKGEVSQPVSPRPIRWWLPK